MLHNKKRIAALSCSYNRVKKTASFLKSLVDQKVPESFTIDYYLLDDNSSDRTADYVKEHYPSVHVLHGSGTLFWAGGMRTLWSEVLKKGSYDFYLLLNDDVTLMEGALEKLLEAYSLSKNPANILLGSVIDPVNNNVTYGGSILRNRFTNSYKLQEPDATNLISCEIGNANIMLVDKLTVNKIGILSDSYTHSLADFDYTLRAVKKGIKVWIAPGFYGYCVNDHGVSWLPQAAPIKKRIAYLHSPKGLAYKEYLNYIQKHFPLMYPDAFFKLWLKTLFPVVYSLFKK